MDTLRLVQQYVERQRPYVPTYTAERPLNERPAGTPAKPPRSDEFGFDTPVLRPRVPVSKASQSQHTNKPGASTSRTKGVESPPNPDPPSEPPLSKGRREAKRKKASMPVDTDSERAARLADRRERKRNKRAIVNPPQKQSKNNVPGAVSKKGKAKKPAALALLYGFSATNVTKDRLTLKPTPSLGVFSKGKASARKKVTATNKSSSKNVIFFESAFLNKSNERVADHSKVDDGSICSISDDPALQPTRAMKRTKDRSKCTEPIAPKTPQASTRPTAESEVWDIELQSKLPSSVRDVSSEPGTNDSGPVVADLRGAGWCASLNVAKEHDDDPGTRSLSIIRTRSKVVRSPPLMTSDLRGELGMPNNADDTPSIHPSHSASQVGRRVVDYQPPAPRVVTSKYFAEPMRMQQFAVQSPQPSRPSDSANSLDYRFPDQDTQGAVMDARTILRVSSPTSSLIGVTQPAVGFQTQCDAAPLGFPSDWSSYDDCYAHADGAFQPHGCSVEVPDDRSIVAQPYHHCCGHLEPSVVQAQGVECQHPQGTGWDSRFQCCTSPGLASDDVAHDFMPSVEGYNPPVADYECDLEEPIGTVEYDPEERHPCDPCPCMGVTREDSDTHEDEGSSCWDDEQRGGMAEFLEGRALLLGVQNRPKHVGLSGLAQAEMDVANRLQDHWRPQRLS